MTNTRIINILDKNEISLYEFRELLDVLFEKMKNNHHWNSISKQITEDIEYGVDKVKSILGVVTSLEEKINTTLVESYERLERQYDDMHKKFALMNKKFSSLEIKFPAVRIPYDMDKLIQYAHSYANWNDDQRKAFLELSKVFKEAK